MPSLPLKNACAFSVSPLINLVGVGLERRGHQCLPLILPNFFTKKMLLTILFVPIELFISIILIRYGTEAVQTQNERNE